VEGSVENGNGVVVENYFGAEPNVQMGDSIETFARDDDGNLLIKTYYPMPVGLGSDPDGHLIEGELAGPSRSKRYSVENHCPGL
jgi:hypothetical protein